MKIYLVCSKFSLLLFYFLLLVLTVLGTLGFTVNANTDIIVASDEDRQHYLTDLGLNELYGPTEVKEITIPWQFNDVYAQYNELQKKGGWDLSLLAGETLQMYTYNYNDLLIHLIINNGKVVGGDICDPSINGFMLPLTAQSVNEISTA